jgi:hypothetical protein
VAKQVFIGHQIKNIWEALKSLIKTCHVGRE